jgi:hypothetical protein
MAQDVSTTRRRIRNHLAAIDRLTDRLESDLERVVPSAIQVRYAAKYRAMLDAARARYHTKKSAADSAQKTLHSIPNTVGKSPNVTEQNDLRQQPEANTSAQHQ